MSGIAGNAARTIADALKLKEPPTPDDIVRYIAGQPLQFDPGSKSTYSNFGYCLLGRIIEKVSAPWPKEKPEWKKIMG